MSLDSDLAALRAYLPDFEQYLKSDTIFWTAGSNLPALTLGGLLFVRRALAARRAQMTAAQIAEFDQLESQAHLQFTRWPANIEKKALKEIGQRLNVWTAALEELGDNYAQAINTRAYLSLLLPLVERLPGAEPHRGRLDALDRRLRNLLSPGNFVWDASLADSFRRDEFWFLYGQPRKRD